METNNWIDLGWSDPILPKRALKAGLFACVSAEVFTVVGDYFQVIEAVGGWGHFGAHAMPFGSP